jgi:hypothetical protein
VVAHRQDRTSRWRRSPSGAPERRPAATGTGQAILCKQGRGPALIDWIALVGWSVGVAAARMPSTVPVSWNYFNQAAALVFGGLRLHGRVVGLHLYHLRPADQFGPLSIVATQGLRDLGGRHVVMLAHIVLLALGLVIVWLVADAVNHTTLPHARSRVAFLVAGGIFILEWNHLALQYLHIDDAIAVVCTAIAVDAIARRSRWWWAAVAIGAATAAKPWAIFFLPLLAAAPYGRRLLAVAVAVIVGAVGWLPFVLADPKTLLAAHYTIAIDPGSVLRLFGVRSGRTPAWDRPAQLGAALALGVTAIRRRRWQGVVLVGVAVRVMLDPSARAYYTTGFVFAALVWDLFEPRWLLPFTTIGVAALLDLPPVLGATPTEAAILRLISAVGAIAVVLVPPLRENAQTPAPAAIVTTRTHALD